MRSEGGINKSAGSSSELVDHLIKVPNRQVWTKATNNFQVKSLSIFQLLINGHTYLSHAGTGRCDLGEPSRVWGEKLKWSDAVKAV